MTEDADLGMRLALAGYHVQDLPSSTMEEAPADLRRWMKQRTRWMKGFMQVAITHGRRPLVNLRALGPVNFLGALALIPGTVVAALGYPALTATALVTTSGTAEDAFTAFAANILPAVGWTVLGIGLLAMIVPPMVGAARRGWWGLVRLAPLMPFYYVLVGAAAWLALVELVRHPARWNKTEHGLARTSRSGALRSAGRVRPPPPRGAARD